MSYPHGIVGVENEIYNAIGWRTHAHAYTLVGDTHDLHVEGLNIHLDTASVCYLTGLEPENAGGAEEIHAVEYEDLQLFLVNVGDEPIIIAHDSSLSVETHRFNLWGRTDLILRPKQLAVFLYVRGLGWLSQRY